MKNILQVAPGFKYGGIESRMVDWYESMDREQVHFDIVKVTPDEPNAMVDKMRALGAEVYSIPSFRKPFRHFIAMRRVLRSGKYSAVHCHSSVYGFYPLLYTKLHGIKVRILHSRTTREGYGKMHFPEAFISKLSVKLATRLFACSQAAGEWIFGNRKFEVINNGIQLANFHFDAEYRSQKRAELGVSDSFVMGNVGRFSSVKNLPLLLNVLKNIVDNGTNAKLILVGNDLGDNIEAALRQKAADLGITDRVIFAGRSERVQDWLNVFDIFLFPSFHEGFGTVAVEAQANGLPCIISTGVPSEVKLFDDVHFADPNDVDTWCELVSRYTTAKRKAGDVEAIANMGYDIVTTAKKLERYYLQNVD